MVYVGCVVCDIMENIIVIDYDCELCVEMYDFGDIGYYLFDCCVIDVEGIVVY